MPFVNCIIYSQIQIYCWSQSTFRVVINGYDTPCVRNQRIMYHMLLHLAFLLTDLKNRTKNRNKFTKDFRNVCNIKPEHPKSHCWNIYNTTPITKTVGHHVRKSNWITHQDKMRNILIFLRFVTHNTCWWKQNSLLLCRIAFS